jgi:rhodanese-related sulfurtransferase
MLRFQEIEGSYMKKLILAVIGVVSATLFLTSCSSDSSAQKVSPKEFSEVISDPSVVILDVRTPQEFAEGHLANAINIDFQSGNFEQEIASLDKSKTYAVYCRSSNRSGEAVKVMADAGFTSMYDMDGGIIDWQAAGGQIVTN